MMHLKIIKWGMLAVLFGLTLSGCATATLPEERLPAAEQALRDYFVALSEGDYETALALYGGSFEPLTGYNPDLGAAEEEALLERACTVNGFVCLPVLEVVSGEQVAEEEFRFVVTFQDADGQEFVLGPCCGANETEMPPQSEFTYEVRLEDGGYVVTELPPYRP